MKHEIICIERAGFNFLHSERVDLAAKVTELRWEPKPYPDYVRPEDITRNELFVPRLVNGIAPDWNTL